jgi:hypothetical protein
VRNIVNLAAQSCRLALVGFRFLFLFFKTHFSIDRQDHEEGNQRKTNFLVVGLIRDQDQGAMEQCNNFAVHSFT